MIDLLGVEYCGMRLRDESDHMARTTFEERTESLRLRCSPSLKPQNMRALSEEYQFAYDGRTYQMDMHVRDNGRGFDSRRLAVVYFCWSDEHGAVLIGSLPRHLNNTLTN
jgi:hypothetical protein